jgi:hypothetical protein
MVSKKPSVSSAHMGFNKPTTYKGVTMHNEPIDFELLLTAVQRCFECRDVCSEECRYYKSKHYLDNNCVRGVHGMEMYVDSASPRGDING